MRKPELLIVVFIISLLFALLVHCSAFDFNISAQKARGDARLDFRIGGGLVSGIFYARVQVGHEHYDLHLDSASSLSWIQCAGDHAKEAPNPPYHPHDNYLRKNDPHCPSHSAHADTHYCDYQLSYIDGGHSAGYVVRDVVPLHDHGSNSLLNPLLVFGCGYYHKHDVDDYMNFDGVLGVGKERSSFPSQLHALGHASNFIGHCFSRQSQGANSGFGFFGRGNVEQLSDHVVWLPMLQSVHYAIGPARISMEGVQLQTNVQAIVLDSGTTYTSFESPIYATIKYMVKRSLMQTNAPLHELEANHDELPFCWADQRRHLYNINQVKQYFEPIELRFSGNRVIELQPEDYLKLTATGKVCLGILATDAHANSVSNILGANAMLDKLVMYDNRRNRIGWSAPRSCTSGASYLETAFLESVKANASSDAEVPHGATHD